MFKKLLFLLCLTLMLHFSSVPDIVEAQSGVDERPSNVVATADVASRAETAVDGLSSAITPPTGPPASIIGTAVAFNGVWVNVASNPPEWVSGTNRCQSSINWGGIFPSTASGFTTCTITLSSVPPGPCYIYLLGPGGTPSSSLVYVDSQVTIINSVSNSDWFKAGADVNPAVIFETAVLEPQLGWWSQTSGSKSDDIVIYSAPYPTLQYAPNSMTIVYQ